MVEVTSFEKKHPLIKVAVTEPIALSFFSEKKEVITCIDGLKGDYYLVDIIRTPTDGTIHFLFKSRNVRGLEGQAFEEFKPTFRTLSNIEELMSRHFQTAIIKIKKELGIK